MTRIYETDVCIVGGGITGTLVAQKLARRTDAHVLVVEAGRSVDPGERRAQLSARYRDYGEHPFPGDRIESHLVPGEPSQTMAIGGRATHWGAQTPRYGPEDFLSGSVHGVGEDWPISYDDLEPFYAEAEWAIGVSGDSEKGARRSKPYPMPPLPLGFNRRAIVRWLDGLGLEAWQAPSAINSQPYDGRPRCAGCGICNACPIGARFSPDVTLGRLGTEGRVRLLSRAFISRLEIRPGSSRVSKAHGRDLETGEAVRVRARAFVLATSTHWTPHLLMSSASSRYPRGLANRSGLVGHYVVGHYLAEAAAPFPGELYPGHTPRHALFSDQFMKAPARSRGVRFGLYVQPAGTFPRFETPAGEPRLGDDILDDWRRRALPRVRFKAWVEALPSRESRVRLDGRRRTPDGAPLPRIEFAPHPHSRRPRPGRSFQRVLGQYVAELEPLGISQEPVHLSGGCRMGADPASSVCDSFGRCHDHENLFLAGAPVCVTGGVCNPTLTFCALALRTASVLASELE